MDLFTALTDDLRVLLSAPDMAELVEQAERLHERVPHGVVVDFITKGLEAAGDNPGALQWKLDAAREVNSLLATDADELEALIA